MSQIQYTLDIREEGQQPKRYPIKHRLIIGSGNDAKIKFSSIILAERHLTFRVHNEVLTLYCARGDFPLFVGKQELQPDKQYILDKGDKIQLPNIEILIRSEIIDTLPENQEKSNSHKLTGIFKFLNKDNGEIDLPEEEQDLEEIESVTRILNAAKLLTSPPPQPNASSVVSPTIPVSATEKKKPTKLKKICHTNETDCPPDLLPENSDDKLSDQLNSEKELAQQLEDIEENEDFEEENTNFNYKQMTKLSSSSAPAYLRLLSGITSFALAYFFCFTLIKYIPMGEELLFGPINQMFNPISPILSFIAVMMIGFFIIDLLSNAVLGVSLPLYFSGIHTEKSERRIAILRSILRSLLLPLFVLDLAILIKKQHPIKDRLLPLTYCFERKLGHLTGPLFCLLLITLSIGSPLITDLDNLAGIQIHSPGAIKASGDPEENLVAANFDSLLFKFKHTGGLPASWLVLPLIGSQSSEIIFLDSTTEVKASLTIETSIPIAHLLELVSEGNPLASLYFPVLNRKSDGLLSAEETQALQNLFKTSFELSPVTFPSAVQILSPLLSGAVNFRKKFLQEFTLGERVHKLAFIRLGTSLFLRITTDTNDTFISLETSPMLVYRLSSKPERLEFRSEVTKRFMQSLRFPLAVKQKDFDGSEKLSPLAFLDLVTRMTKGWTPPDHLLAPAKSYLEDLHLITTSYPEGEITQIVNKVLKRAANALEKNSLDFAKTLTDAISQRPATKLTPPMIDETFNIDATSLEEGNE